MAGEIFFVCEKWTLGVQNFRMFWIRFYWVWFAHWNTFQHPWKIERVFFWVLLLHETNQKITQHWWCCFLYRSIFSLFFNPQTDRVDRWSIAEAHQSHCQINGRGRRVGGAERSERFASLMKSVRCFSVHRQLETYRANRMTFLFMAATGRTGCSLAFIDTGIQMGAVAVLYTCHMFLVLLHVVFDFGLTKRHFGPWHFGFLSKSKWFLVEVATSGLRGVSLEVLYKMTMVYDNWHQISWMLKGLAYRQRLYQLSGWFFERRGEGSCFPRGSRGVELEKMRFESFVWWDLMN